MEISTIIIVLFVALVAYVFFFRDLAPEEMSRKSDARLLRALELAKQSSNEKDLPIVIAEVERRGLLKATENDEPTVPQKQPSKTLSTIKVSIDGSDELTFHELAETVILGGVNGTYGLLFQDDVDEHYGTISTKVLENPNNSQLIMACIVASIHYCYLTYRLPPDDKLSDKGIDNLGANFDGYIKGVEAGFRNLQVEGKDILTPEGVDYFVSIFRWYAKAYMKEMNMAFGTGNISNPQGSKSAQGLLESMFSIYGIERSNDYEIANDGTSAEFRVDIIASTLLIQLDGYLKISGKI